MDREMDRAEQQMSKKKDEEANANWDKRKKIVADDKRRSKIMEDYDRRRSFIAGRRP